VIFSREKREKLLDNHAPNENNRDHRAESKKKNQVKIFDQFFSQHLTVPTTQKNGHASFGRVFNVCCRSSKVSYPEKKEKQRRAGETACGETRTHSAPFATCAHPTLGNGPTEVTRIKISLNRKENPNEGETQLRNDDLKGT
jgi:hypothetical protein